LRKKRNARARRLARQTGSEKNRRAKFQARLLCRQQPRNPQRSARRQRAAPRPRRRQKANRQSPPLNGLLPSVRVRPRSRKGELQSLAGGKIDNEFQLQQAGSDSTSIVWRILVWRFVMADSAKLVYNGFCMAPPN